MTRRKPRAADLWPTLDHHRKVTPQSGTSDDQISRQRATRPCDRWVPDLGGSDGTPTLLRESPRRSRAKLTSRQLIVVAYFAQLRVRGCRPHRRFRREAVRVCRAAIARVRQRPQRSLRPQHQRLARLVAESKSTARLLRLPSE